MARLTGHIPLLLGIAVFALGCLAAATIGAASERVDIPVPAGVIYAGDVVQSSSLRPRSVPANYPSRAGVFTNTTGLVGMVARTTLLPGRPIALNQVIDPDVVAVNRPTIMRYVHGGLMITSEVLPLNSAKAGEMVRARNAHTGAIVTGFAGEDGIIHAGLSAAHQQSAASRVRQ